MAKRSLDELFTREIYDKLASRGSMSTRIASQILDVHYMTIYSRIKTGTLRATRNIDEFNFPYKLTDEDIVTSFNGDLRLLREARRRAEYAKRKTARKLFMKKGDIFNLGRDISQWS